ncbi:MAG: hydrogenase nickel incorporation protein HypB [Cytophagales bacterium]|nr:hydrogenase nickel incorporation protein HypB [Cytophagales bacterium]
MCSTCGCGQPDEAVKILRPGDRDTENNLNHEGHHHDHHHHGHHDHHHDHHHSHSSQIDLEKNILHENDLLAQRNRGFLEAKNVFAINMVSSPGSGKTTLLEETITKLKSEVELSIIEGDQQTLNDAMRIEATGVPVVQINTGKGCHLDAHMVLHAIKKLDLKENSLLFIENVGNLVCPSMFDLGENKRAVIISVTEGEDKPLKYPYMFDSSQICIINKIDLLPYVNFDVEKAKEYALRINHHLDFFELSATTGEGMENWLKWLKGQLKKE